MYANGRFWEAKRGLPGGVDGHGEMKGCFLGIDYQCFDTKQVQEVYLHSL